MPLEQILDYYLAGQANEAAALCSDRIVLAALTEVDAGEIARAAAQSGDFATAVRMAELALERGSLDSTMLRILGRGYRELGEPHKACGCYERLLELIGATANDLNDLGACLLEQRDLDGAIAHFERALVLDPDLPEAHYNLGNAHQVQGRLDTAIVHYRRALELKSEYSDAWANLGAALYQRGEMAEAILSYRRALELRPDVPEVHNNIGVLHHRSGDLPLAGKRYRSALELKPDYVDAMVNLGGLLREQGHLWDAVAVYRRALALNERDHETRNQLGAALMESGDFADAEACFRVLAEQLPESPEAWNNLGAVLHLNGALDEAVACYGKALELAADHTDSMNNLAAAYREQGRFAESAAGYEQVLQLRPQLPAAHLGLAEIGCVQGRFWEARWRYYRALEAAPDDAEVRLARALGLLRIGDLTIGWNEFEWRWQTCRYKPPDIGLPAWRGEPLAGRRILVHAEQGIGDTIHFARYLTHLQQLGAEVFFAVRPELFSLFENFTGATQLVPLGETIDVSQCDFHAGLLSLPMLLGITWESIDGPTRYLFPHPPLIDKWRQRLGAHAGLHVGICWHGNPRNRRDKYRSIPPQYLDEMLRLDGITFVNLQRESCAGLPGFGARVVDFSSELDVRSGAFVDTAALMKSLDLVICCDTAVAHLAGAVGVPVWLALEYFADWRWFLDRDDSPWYPTMRLFRQPTPRNWLAVVKDMVAALKAWPK